MAGCNSASVGRDWEGSSTPHGWQKPPCFDRIQRGGEQVFQLCPCRERIKLCGDAAGWHGALVCCVIVSIPAPMAPGICVVKKILKKRLNSSRSLFTLWKIPCTILSLGERRWRTAQRYCILLGRRYIRGPFCAIFVQKSSGQRWRGWAECEGETEMSLQSRVRCLDSIGHLAEISALPIAACLRRSASVLEILCLGRRTRRPRARARLPQET